MGGSEGEKTVGAWGSGLFSDDTACDIRDTYRDLIADGKSGSEATDLLLQQWQQELADLDEGPVFWLALAATQWKLGRLEDRVKAGALRVIDTGAGLDRWREDPKLLQKRQAVLAKLRAELETPQRPPKKIAKPYVEISDWEVGEMIAYRLPSGRLAILRVTSQDTYFGGKSPECEVLGWDEQTEPTEEELARLPLREGIKEQRPEEFPVTKQTLNQLKRDGRIAQDVTLEALRREFLHPKPRFTLGRTGPRAFPSNRVKRLGVRTPPAAKPLWPGLVCVWQNLDKLLEEWFGLK